MDDVQEVVIENEASTSNTDSESMIQQAASHIVQDSRSIPLHPSLKWLYVTEQRYPWSKNATIRYSNTPLLTFVLLNILEDPTSLIHCLRDLQGSSFDLTDWDRALLFRILDDDGVTTTLENISFVKYEWLKKGPAPTNAHTSSAPIRAGFSVSSKLRFEDHQIIRTLWCVTCTHRAACNLAAIAEIPFAIEISKWTLAEQDPSYFEITALRSLTRIHALYAAVQGIQFRLMMSPTTPDSPRVQLADSACRQTWGLVAALEAHDSSSLLVDRDSVLTEVLPEPMASAIAQVLLTSSWDGPSALLIRTIDNSITAGGLGQGGRKWCLMVLKDADFNNVTELAGLLREATNEAGGVVIEHEIVDQKSHITTLNLGFVGPEDARFLSDWETSLASD
jgi:hypothetical protein